MLWDGCGVKPDLQHTRFAKTVVTTSIRIGPGATDDDMIQQLDIDGSCCLAELSRQLKIRGAGRRIATRMVVGADDRTRGFANDFTKNFPWMSQSSRRRTG